MRRIRILHVIPTLDQSGAEKQLALLASGLPKERFDVRVCALTRGGYYASVLADAGVPVDVLNKRLKWDPLAWRRLCRLMADHCPDIVHTWLFAGNTYGRLAARWARVPRVIAAERCVDRWKRQYQLALDRALAHWTDTLVVNADAVRQFYEYHGIPSRKLVVIPNGVPENSESSPLEEVERARRLAELECPPDQPILGFIGRLWPQKRVQDLIWATDVLRIGGWNVHLLIVGDGPRRASLERFAHNLELDGCVHFLGHRSDVDALLPLMDVVVLPSKFEGMPNVALEAMGAGKPVVATRIQGMDEVVVDGVTGILVEPQRPFELAKGIHHLLSNDELRQRYGAAGRKRVRDHFSVERMIEAYIELYQRTLGAL